MSEPTSHGASDSNTLSYCCYHLLLIIARHQDAVPMSTPPLDARIFVHEFPLRRITRMTARPTMVLKRAVIVLNEMIIPARSAFLPSCPDPWTTTIPYLSDLGYTLSGASTGIGDHEQGCIRGPLKGTGNRRMLFHPRQSCRWRSRRVQHLYSQWSGFSVLNLFCCNS